MPIPPIPIPETDSLPFPVRVDKESKDREGVDESRISIKRWSCAGINICLLHRIENLHQLQLLPMHLLPNGSGVHLGWTVCGLAAFRVNLMDMKLE